MPQFNVDEDIAALVEKLAKPKPFENLSFNSALRRVIHWHMTDPELEQLLAESIALAKNTPKKSPSPDSQQWATSIPELKAKNGLDTWKSICDLLKIETAGDSARRKLSNWVKANRPNWPAVPAISGD